MARERFFFLHGLLRTGETPTWRSVFLERLPARQAARSIRNAERVENLSAKVDNSGVRYHTEVKANWSCHVCRARIGAALIVR
jgi:hypothetical protein